MPVAALECPCLALWSSKMLCSGQGREWGWLLPSYTLIMTVFSKATLKQDHGCWKWGWYHLSLSSFLVWPGLLGLFISPWDKQLGERWAAFVLSRMGYVCNTFVPSRSRFPTSRLRDSWIPISGVQVFLWMVESGLPLQPAELVLRGPGIEEQVQMVRLTQQ